jgi:pyruvate/2-oxoglutarate/acetoin dehydrogenase E1 component
LLQEAEIIENFWDYLDAPIMCLSSQDLPTPYAGTLEARDSNAERNANICEGVRVRDRFEGSVSKNSEATCVFDG